MLPDSRQSQRAESRRQLIYELLSGSSGLVLALFMWGHMVLVGTILTGERGFDWLATALEDYYIAQATVFVISALFLLHAVLASRKIPAQLRERKTMLKLAGDLAGSGRGDAYPASEFSVFRPHVDSLLWIWQVRTGMVVLVLGSFHIVLLGIDVLTPLFGERVGIEAVTSLARVQAGLWLPYAVLLICVEFHAGIGLYRLAIKWGAGAMLNRETLRVIEHVLLWFFLGLGVVILLVLAGIIEPPLQFIMPDTGL